MNTTAALMDCGLCPDTSEKVLKHKAAQTIQRFFRQSQYCVVADNEYWPQRMWPCRNIGVFKHPRHAQHGSAKFQGIHVRTVQHRYKPLHIALKSMMKMILQEKPSFMGRKTQYKKRKNMYYKVTLMRRGKHFGDIPLITVTNETVF